MKSQLSVASGESLAIGYHTRMRKQEQSLMLCVTGFFSSVIVWVSNPLGPWIERELGEILNSWL